MYNYILRAVQKKDTQEIYSIEKECFNDPWSLESIDSEYYNPVAKYFIAEINQNLVAYAGMWIVIDEAHITNVATLKKYRGIGIGRALMQELINCAIELGAKSMTLEVRKSNAIAKSLYYSLGFIDAGLRKKFYPDGEDAIIMWKNKL